MWKVKEEDSKKLSLFYNTNTNDLTLVNIFKQNLTVLGISLVIRHSLHDPVHEV